MKKFSILFLVFATLTLTSCNDSAAKKVNKEMASTAEKAAQSDAANVNAAITFDEMSYDFGVINEGDKVETKFKFTNTGAADLIIREARGSCGCTVPEYPKNTPIAPGETRDIKVKFDSANKPGNQTKTVTLTNNTERGRDIIRIKTMVTADPIKEQQRQAARNQMNQ